MSGGRNDICALREHPHPASLASFTEHGDNYFVSDSDIFIQLAPRAGQPESWSCKPGAACAAERKHDADAPLDPKSQ
jgi:hypothetical protein